MVQMVLESDPLFPHLIKPSHLNELLLSLAQMYIKTSAYVSL